MAYTVVDKGSKYFNTVLYTGTGASNSVTGVGFKPDMVWLKNRNSTQNHFLTNSVTSNEFIIVNDTNTADTNSSYTQTYNADGFTLQSGAVAMNTNTNTYVAWNWLGSNTTASNTVGTITSTVSANTTSGFSIVSYTGNGSGTATIGHGIGTTPACVILRPRSYAGAWWITHKNLSTDNVLEFNTNAQVSYSSFGGGGLRQSQYTSSIITGGNGSSNSNLWNNSGSTYIAYCFAEVKGYSKFGSYTGNGSSNGTFVYTGFKPAFVMVKSTGAGQNWLMQNNKTLGYNASNSELYANLSNAEGTFDRADLLSNGFKTRINSGENNSSGVTYIYMAFAENPFVSSKGLPTTAR